MKQERVKKLTLDLEKWNLEKSEEENLLDEKVKNFIEVKDNYESRSKKWDLEKELREFRKDKVKILNNLKEPEFIPNTDLQEFELSNLIRLGIVKAIQQHYAYTNSAKIYNDSNADYLYLEDLEIEITDDGEIYALSELGELFLKACSEKK